VIAAWAGAAKTSVAKRQQPNVRSVPIPSESVPAARVAHNLGRTLADVPTRPRLTEAERWERDVFRRAPEREASFSTISGELVGPLYTEADLPVDVGGAVGLPGVFPFTRGVYGSMYRGRLWTMRQFAGFGTAVETNERFRYLLDHGQTGLSTAFDMPSLMGLDSDHPRSLGEVGREGVAVDSVADMGVLFAGIPLDEVTVSMTINAPAAVMLAFYVVAAERRGIPAERLAGTIQTDILKEYIAQKEWCFPVDPAMRLVGDMIEWCSGHMPRWHPVSISGYHIREAGSTAAQELAFTLKDGLTYVEEAVARGLEVDAFAPRLSFFFNAHIDFFEEIAKYRAARRIWARELRDRFGARDQRSLLMRFHTQTAGVSLTAQQPLNNVVRTAIEALAGVLGGTQSLHTNSFDEALALPTEGAVRVALRTQQIIAEETGVVNTIDPLGGSYFVEALTDRLEALAYEYFAKIDELGGMVEAVKRGFPQREIADAAFRYQREVEAGVRRVVGVNAFTEGGDGATEILRIDPAFESDQVRRVGEYRERRDRQRTLAALVALEGAARDERENLMPYLIEGARADATEGEMIEALQRVFGTYREQPSF
jgi:methylmalonyl-CoA mutase, N-terminal domain